MAEEKKKVEFRIQISQKKPKLPEPKQPKIITEWHYGRIVLGFVALFVIVVVAMQLLTGSEPKTQIEEKLEQKPELAKAVAKVAPVSVVTPQNDTAAKPKVNNQETTITPITETPKLTTTATRQAPAEGVMAKPTAMPTESGSLPKGVLRSRLASGLWENEPFGEVSFPVKVNNKQATGLFYFTELEGMAGQSIYHVWKRDGKIIFKQKKRIVSNRFKTHTSKLLTMSSIGPWTVSTTDSNLKALHTIAFDVAAE